LVKGLLLFEVRSLFTQEKKEQDQFERQKDLERGAPEENERKEKKRGPSKDETLNLP